MYFQSGREEAAASKTKEAQFPARLSEEGRIVCVSEPGAAVSTENKRSIYNSTVFSYCKGIIDKCQSFPPHLCDSQVMAKYRKYVKKN